jgi:WhiB family redox-sensing transcriptional regulator
MGTETYHFTVVRERPEWMDNKHLACRKSPELFFPDNTESAKQNKAIAICLGCPYRLHCAEYAITNYEDHGVWGGTTARERQRIRRARNNQPAAS